jgi:hypothetical protein
LTGVRATYGGGGETDTNGESEGQLVEEKRSTEAGENKGFRSAAKEWIAATGCGPRGL